MRLAILFQFLKQAPFYFYYGLQKVAMFFTSGWKSYLAMFTFVFYDHREPVMALDAAQFLHDVGVSMAQADMRIAENLQAILMGAEGLNYFSSFLNILIAAFTILWFIRTIATIIIFVWGEMIPDIVAYMVGIMIWIIAVLYVQNSFPTALIDLIYNIGDVWEPARLNPLKKANVSAVNRSEFSFVDFYNYTNSSA